MCIEQPKRRIHNKIPLYPKVYTVYAYNRKKFTTIYKKLQAVALRLNKPEIYFSVSPYKVLSLCYLRDKQNALKSMGDEKHIFRYKVLHTILSEIAAILLEKYNIHQNTIPYLYYRTGLMLFMDDLSQGEFLCAHAGMIADRIKIHITLLRCLKADFEIEDAVEYTKLAHKEVFKKLLINDWRRLKDVYI